MRRQLKRSSLAFRGCARALVVATAMSGCGTAEIDSTIVVHDPVNRGGRTASGALVEQAEAAGDAGGEAEAEATAAYAAPFPNRDDPFMPPKAGRSAARISGSDSEELVELKGFVRVDEPRAVLAIDGVVAPLAEGGERYGVQVISIAPPKVVLQRGSTRWTTSLD